jgi:hypothetical protein
MTTQKRKAGLARGVGSGVRLHANHRKSGPLGVAFRARLEDVIARAGSVKACAVRLKAESRSKANYEPRVAEWRAGKNLPSADGLALIARTFDVSVDWLLGFQVPERRSEREPVGDVRRLLLHEIHQLSDLDTVDIAVLTGAIPPGERLMNWTAELVVKQHAEMLDYSRRARLKAIIASHEQSRSRNRGLRPIARAMMSQSLDPATIAHLTRAASDRGARSTRRLLGKKAKANT